MELSPQAQQKVGKPVLRAVSTDAIEGMENHSYSCLNSLKREIGKTVLRVVSTGSTESSENNSCVCYRPEHQQLRCEDFPPLPYPYEKGEAAILSIYMDQCI